VQTPQQREETIPMSDVASAFENSKPLSQPERVVDTFIAPSKTFTDVLRNASWWLPCVLIVLVSAIFSYVAIHKVGVARMSDNLIATMPKIQDILANAKPEDAQAIHTRFESNVKGQFYSAPLVLLVSSFAISGLFLLTANFGFGGRATYKGMLAMFWYSILPLLVASTLICVLLAAGVNTESFRVSNPIGTNPGYYLPEGSSPVMVAALSFLDLFSIWVFCLQTLGTSIVARITLGKAIVAVGIWWVLYLLLKIVPAMMFS
jgi:hypothetical protein